MNTEFLAKLNSARRGERLHAWSDLDSQPESSNYRISAEDRQALAEIIQNEPDEVVKLHALSHLAGFSVQCTHDSDSSTARNRTPTTLDDWFSSPFKSSSVVLGVREKTAERRDELALVKLARRFSYESYPLTAFEVVPLEDNSWKQLTEDRNYVSILAVGRLALFGDEATSLLSNKQLRFRFPSIDRPALAGRKLSPDYHQIIEKSPEKNGSTELIRPYDQGSIRTDYALVQLYPVIYGGRNRTTVGVCAGCTSLGTLGAARWLAYDLGGKYDQLDGKKITLPPHIQSNSRLEVLLRVTADLELNQDHPTIEVCRMYLDDWQWKAESNTWFPARSNTLELTGRIGEIETMKLNDAILKFRRQSQNQKIAAFLFETMVKTGTNHVKLLDIKENEHIWNGACNKLADVRRRLHNLKNNKLQGTIDVRGEDVYFNGIIKLNGIVQLDDDLNPPVPGGLP